MNYSNTTLISENIWKMFWNKTVHPDDNVWYALRTCYAANKLYNIFYINSFYGRIEDNNVEGVSTVRPAFQIDLSKISWSLVEVGADTTECVGTKLMLKWNVYMTRLRSRPILRILHIVGASMRTIPTRSTASTRGLESSCVISVLTFTATFPQETALLSA